MTLVHSFSTVGGLASCGGKGMNLTRLVASGFQVPPGFVLVTDAYRRFVAAHGLDDVVAGVCAGLVAADADALERASQRIRAAFEAYPVPGEIVDAVRAAWSKTFKEGSAVAVRSSATAEDLPDLSFAGQQDTFLNVMGVDEVMKAVVKCWSSLWTARAIGYRLRNGIGDDVALAVVVQAMAPAEVSGVMFTANPLTGARDEVVIDATYGLGEALVSGQVEPDHFEVRSGEVAATLGAKAVATAPLPGGGVETVERTEHGACLSDAQVKELAGLGRRIAEAFGAPQDIEFALVDGRCQVLQSRPITSLYPVPPGGPESIWFSFGAVQGLLAPITPLGCDALRCLYSGAASLVGGKTPDGVMEPVGERLWLRIDKALRHPIGWRVLTRLLPNVESSVAAIVQRLIDERGWGPPQGRLSRGSLRGLAQVARYVLPGVVPSLARPERRRRVATAASDRVVADARARLKEVSGASVAERVRVVRDLLRGLLPSVAAALLSVTPTALGTLFVLRAMAAKAGPQTEALVLETLRGVPGDVTTEMDLALWDVAKVIRDDPRALEVVRAEVPEELAARFVAGRLPGRSQDAVAGFLERYGMRGVGEIDLGQPRWRESPAEVLRTLKSYIDLPEDQAPDRVFDRGAAAAREAGRELERRLATGHGLREAWRRRRVRFIVDRMRRLIGLRESPKFTVVRVLGEVRETLLACGRDLVTAGVLERAEDVVCLHLDELERLAAEPVGPWPDVVTARREVASREARRRQVPRVLLGDGRTFFEGVGGEGALQGSGVSPGVAEGRVRVVLDPSSAQLDPGEILVCPGTDPAWTPLFLAAGGLVTEVGGMITHGSVVAREYGIPAVVGVHEATTRLATGQRIRLDGTAGTVELLDE